MQSAVDGKEELELHHKNSVQTKSHGNEHDHQKNNCYFGRVSSIFQWIIEKRINCITTTHMNGIQ